MGGAEYGYGQGIPARHSLLRVPEDPQTQVVDARAVSLHEGLERVGAPVLEPSDEQFVGLGGSHRVERYSEGGPAVSVTVTAAKSSVQEMR